MSYCLIPLKDLFIASCILASSHATNFAVNGIKLLVKSTNSVGLIHVTTAVEVCMLMCTWLESHGSGSCAHPIEVPRQDSTGIKSPSGMERASMSCNSLDCHT